MEVHRGGFFEALFDTSFTEFITPKIVRLLYIIGIVIAAIAAIVFIISGFSDSGFVGVLFLLLSPVIFLLYVILFRISLESLLVLFTIAENTRK